MTDRDTLLARWDYDENIQEVTARNDDEYEPPRPLWLGRADHALGAVAVVFAVCALAAAIWGRALVELVKGVVLWKI